MEKLPVTRAEIEAILSRFPLDVEEATSFCDSSHGEEDIRWNLIFKE